MEELTNLSVIVISQYISVSNNHIAHLELTQCYAPIISHKKLLKENNENFPWDIKNNMHFCSNKYVLKAKYTFCSLCEAMSIPEAYS